MPNYSGVWSLPAQYQAKANLQWPQGPGAPTSVSATAGDAQATVSFTAPTFTGVPPGITGYLATSSPGGFTATGSASPLTVTGLSNGTAYTFTVQATNGVQYGPAGTSESVTPASIRGIFSGGEAFTNSFIKVNTIDYVTIATTGNATDFGDLSVSRDNLAGCSSSSRGLFGGGYSSDTSNSIDYITIASVGNATDFGDLTVARWALAACSSSTRGVFGGGFNNSDVRQNVMDYVTIASAGNATDFGDIAYFGANAIRAQLAGCSSTTRGLFAGGTDSTGGNSNYIFYITIASVGDTTYFGNLTSERRWLASCSSATRGVFAGGLVSSNSNIIDYVTIASTGNATDFGDLASAERGQAGCSSSTRGLFGGGTTGPSNIIEYITIASAGDATDFGDLTQGRRYLSSCSNAHGGL